MISEVEDFICIIEVTDLPETAQTDSSYLYEDWNNLLASSLGSLSLELSQRHATTTDSTAASPTSLKVRKYEHQSTTPEAAFPTSDSTSEVLVCGPKMITELPKKPDSQSESQPDFDVTDEQSILPNQLVNTFLQLSKEKAKKTSTKSVSADIKSEHILQKKQIRNSSEQQAVNTLTVTTDVQFNSIFLFQFFFIFIDHSHQSHH